MAGEKLKEGDWRNVHDGSQTETETVTDKATEEPKVKAEDSQVEDELLDEEDEDKPKGDQAGEDDADKADKGKKGFDKSIQPALQELANERKKREALEGQVTQLQKQLTDLTATLSDKSTADDKGKKSNDAQAIDEIDKLVEKLSDLSDADDVTAAIKAIAKQIKSLRTSSGDAETTKKLQDRLDSFEKWQQESDKKSQNKADQVALNAMLDELDQQHGVEYHTEAVARAKEHFKELGLKPEQISNLEVRQAFKIAYLELSAGDGKKAKPKGDKPRKPSVTLDTGNGGRSAPVEGKPKSFADALDKLQGRQWQYEDGEDAD